jgi:hypothetical protein
MRKNREVVGDRIRTIKGRNSVQIGEYEGFCNSVRGGNRGNKAKEKNE